MKKQLTLISIVLFCFTLAFLLMSCGPAPSNTNQAANSNSSNDVAKMSGPCNRDQILAKMDKIVEEEGIKNQHDGSDHPDHKVNLDYDVVQNGNWNVLVIEGGISDGLDLQPNEKPKNREFMEKFVKAVDQLVKNDCAFKAVFVKRGTREALKTGKLKVEELEGFEWSMCYWPKMACPNGTCALDCDRKESPSPTPGMSPSPSPTPSPGARTSSNSNARGNT